MTWPTCGSQSPPTLLVDSAGCGLWNGDLVLFCRAGRCQKSVRRGGERCGQACRGEHVLFNQALI